jgi:MerR family transcriptional regulator, light-induced transcriptional regulator
MAERVEGAAARLGDTARPAAARHGAVRDAAAQQLLDRLARLVSALLDVPLAMINLVDGDRLLFASWVAPDDANLDERGIPLPHSICRHAVLSRKPLVIEDAHAHPEFRDLPVTKDLGVAGYLGVPLLSSSGKATGTLCAIDSKPRTWDAHEVATLEDLAATVIAYLERTPERPPHGAEGLNIAAVAQRTGIGADTLRKWERRYGVLRPNRTTGGQRRYDERDVARVEWLRDRLADGFRIGEAAALLTDDAATTTSSTSGLRDAIVAAAGDSDPRRLPALVDQAFTLHGVEIAVEEILAPALRAVGDRWTEGAECIADEHLLSESIRSHLRSLLADRRHPVRGTAVLACAPGERHELGLLALAVMLQADGWLAVYLGADAPLESSLALTSRLGAGVLCLSASSPDLLDDLNSRLAGTRLPDATRVLTGGAASDPPLRLGEIVAGLRGG